MTEQVYYFTRKGLKKLEQQIKDLEAKVREIQADSGNAAEVGGNQYHDNASYENLVIELRGADFRLKEACRVRNNAMIVNIVDKSDTVVLGSCVRLLWNGEEKEWSIVGYGESEVHSRYLAYNTPLAGVLLGKGVGDCFNVLIGNQQVEVEILNIKQVRLDEDE